MNSKLVFHPVLAVAFLIGTVACSSTPPPRAELQQAERALDIATEQNASTHAPVLVSDAQRKVSDAQVLMKKKQHSAARRLLQQAAVDAELATATAHASQTQLQHEQIKASIEALTPAAEQQVFSDNY